MTSHALAIPYNLGNLSFDCSIEGLAIENEVSELRIFAMDFDGQFKQAAGTIAAHSGMTATAIVT